jgi:catechol 2,3-dioxygenase-like lactoylglutathione lyase family enzyme
MTESRTNIREVGTIFVPVSDQERALAFYVHKLGFEQCADFSYGHGHRWIEVAPPGAGSRLALVPPTEGVSAGGDVTRCAFATDDIDAVHDSLSSQGVDIDREIGRDGTARSGLVSSALVVQDPVPPQFFVRDPDGNRFLIVEAPAQ